MAGVYLNKEGKEVKVPDYGIYNFERLQSEWTTDLVKFTSADNSLDSAFIDICYPFASHEKNKTDGWIVPVIRDSNISWDYAMHQAREFIDKYKGGL